MVKENYQNLLFYKYTSIEDPDELMTAQRLLCQELNIKGRIIVAKEGINGTLESTTENISKYIEIMKQDSRFEDVHFKRSDSNGNAFPKLSVKVRDEIVSTHLKERDIDPTKITGKYLTAEELHNWFESKKEFYIVDMRNDYEHKVGYFEDSILPGLSKFRDLPGVIEEISHLKNKTILTVCTGGVRCEKASGFLVNNGFNDVYQLYGGIQTYMEKFPNKNFKGKLYVFDGRITIGFNTDSPEHEIVSNCEKCGEKSDHYINCNYVHCEDHTHFICCEKCFAEGKGFCSEKCKTKAEESQAFLYVEMLERSL